VFWALLVPAYASLGIPKASDRGIALGGVIALIQPRADGLGGNEVSGADVGEVVGRWAVDYNLCVFDDARDTICANVVSVAAGRASQSGRRWRPHAAVSNCAGRR